MRCDPPLSRRGEQAGDVALAGDPVRREQGLARRTAGAAPAPSAPRTRSPTWGLPARGAERAISCSSQSSTGSSCGPAHPPCRMEPEPQRSCRTSTSLRCDVGERRARLRRGDERLERASDVGARTAIEASRHSRALDVCVAVAPARPRACPRANRAAIGDRARIQDSAAAAGRCPRPSTGKGVSAGSLPVSRSTPMTLGRSIGKSVRRKRLRVTKRFAIHRGHHPLWQRTRTIESMSEATMARSWHVALELRAARSSGASVRSRRARRPRGVRGAAPAERDVIVRWTELRRRMAERAWIAIREPRRPPSRRHALRCARDAGELAAEAFGFRTRAGSRRARCAHARLLSS